MRTRRGFLGFGAGALLAAALPLPAFAAEDTWVVSYLWTRTLARAIAHRAAVAAALGPELASTLIIVRGDTGYWGLLDEVSNTDRDVVTQVARERHERLRAVLGGTDILAAAMPNSDYTRTWHVAYGLLPSEAEGRARTEQIAGLLGPEVASALVLESAAGQWQPMYERYGEKEGTAELAKQQSKILAAHDIPAMVIPDRYLDPRWAALESAVPEEVGLPPKEAPDPKAVAPEEPGEPVAKARPSEPLDLPAACETPLRDAINAYVQDLRKRKLIDPDETTSWYVQTLHDDRTWAAINAERSLQCASMVKPYVALAFLHRVEEGRILYGDESRAKLEAMIQYSSNTATNWAIMLLGGPASVQRILTENYGHLLRETSITETIPQSGRTYKNRSSARDYVRFSRALWRGELPRNAELERLMSLPGRDRLYTGAPDIPKCTQVMNKTGTTSQLCGDFGILVAQSRAGKKVPYAIVGIIEKSCAASSYGAWVASRTQVIRGVSNLAYMTLKEHYGLV